MDTYSVASFNRHSRSTPPVTVPVSTLFALVVDRGLWVVGRMVKEGGDEEVGPSFQVRAVEVVHLAPSRTVSHRAITSRVNRFAKQ